MKYKMTIKRCSFIPQARTCDMVNIIYANNYEIALYKFNKKINHMIKAFENKAFIVTTNTIKENEIEMLVESSKTKSFLYELLITLEEK